VDRAAEQILPQRVGEAAHRELRRDVKRSTVIRLPTGDRADVDDVAAVGQVRQAEPRHSDQPVDVRLQHDLLVFLAALVKEVAAKGEARVVHEDVESVEALHCARHEAGGALRVRDVQLDGNEAVAEVPEPIEPARADGDGCSLAGKGLRRGRTDAARGAGDDRLLAVQRAHGRGAYGFGTIGSVRRRR
jgi:hypothetical protein